MWAGRGNASLGWRFDPDINQGVALDCTAHHFTRQGERDDQRALRHAIALLAEPFYRHSCHVMWRIRPNARAKALFGGLGADETARLPLPVPGIKPTLGQKRVMRPFLDDAAGIHHDDPIHLCQGR